MPTATSDEEIKKQIKNKVVEIAASLGNNARNLKDSDLIPQSGLLDSAGIMELIMWYEAQWDLNIPQSELTVENFGSINAMVDWLHKGRQ